MVTLLSMSGLLIAVFIYEVDTGGYAGPTYNVLDVEEYPNPMDHPRNKYWFTNSARLAIAICTCLSIFFLWL